MRVIFFGTPDVSVDFLKDLISAEEVVGVVTQPDKPAKRGQRLQPPPVKTVAEQAGIPVFQPEKFTPELIQCLKDLAPDVGVVVSYGKLIPQSVFTLPVYGCFNIHFSLLPKYRGAAPVQWALINGESETGVSSFWLERTLDTGPVLVRKKLPIAPEDDAQSLMKKLISLGVEAMRETLGRLKSGQCAGSLQEGEPTFAPSLTKEQGRIDWNKSARVISNLIRGTKTWPGAYTLAGIGPDTPRTLKVLSARPLDTCPTGVSCSSDPVPGRIAGTVKNKGFLVRCGEGFLLVEEVHPENKARMSAWSYLQGGQLRVGDTLR